jgi:hypothetical protein
MARLRFPLVAWMGVHSPRDSVVSARAKGHFPSSSQCVSGPRKSAFHLRPAGGRAGKESQSRVSGTTPLPHRPLPLHMGSSLRRHARCGTPFAVYRHNRQGLLAQGIMQVAMLTPRPRTPAFVTIRKPRPRGPPRSLGSARSRFPCYGAIIATPQTLHSLRGLAPSEGARRPGPDTV